MNFNKLLEFPGICIIIGIILIIIAIILGVLAYKREKKNDNKTDDVSYNNDNYEVEQIHLVDEIGSVSKKEETKENIKEEVPIKEEVKENINEVVIEEDIDDSDFFLDKDLPSNDDFIELNEDNKNEETETL